MLLTTEAERHRENRDRMNRIGGIRIRNARVASPVAFRWGSGQPNGISTPIILLLFIPSILFILSPELPFQHEGTKFTQKPQRR
jgi:hypothetical protein